MSVRREISFSPKRVHFAGHTLYSSTASMYSLDALTQAEFKTIPEKGSPGVGNIPEMSKNGNYLGDNGFKRCVCVS